MSKNLIVNASIAEPVLKSYRARSMAQDYPGLVDSLVNAVEGQPAESPVAHLIQSVQDAVDEFVEFDDDMDWLMAWGDFLHNIIWAGLEGDSVEAEAKTLHFLVDIHLGSYYGPIVDPLDSFIDAEAEVHVDPATLWVDCLAGFAYLNRLVID